MPIHRILIAIVASATLWACDRSEQQQQQQQQATSSEQPAAARVPNTHEALVRVIHANPSAPISDVYAGDQKTFTAVGFGTATPYKAVPHEFKIAFKPAGQDSGPVLLETKAGVKPGLRYTVLADLDRTGASTINVLSDDLQPPSAGKALVRIVHADPEAGPADLVSLSRPDDPVIEGVAFDAPSRYQEVDPAELTVRIFARTEAPVTNKNDRMSTILSKATLEAGKAYTLVVAASDEPGQASKLIKVEDTIDATVASVPAADVTGKVPASQPVDSDGDGTPEIQAQPQPQPQPPAAR